MSWSKSFGPVQPADVIKAIDAVQFNENDLAVHTDAAKASMADQLDVAKDAAKVLMAALVGPVNITLSGHANGVGGDPPPAGWANDCITVSIYQNPGNA